MGSAALLLILLLLLRLAQAEALGLFYWKLLVAHAVWDEAARQGGSDEVAEAARCLVLLVHYACCLLE